MIENYYDNDELASIYHAYDCVYQSIYEPFSLCQPETLFNAAKFSLALLQKRISTPKGISLLYPFRFLKNQ